MKPRRVEKWLPNGVNTRYAYNPDNTLKQVINRASSATIISQHDYLYDGFGNRRQGIDKIGTVTQTNTYTYDSLDRLLTAKNGTVTLDEAYTYSPINNLTQQTIGTPVTTTNAYVYDAANQVLESRVGTTSGTILSANVFDANGGLTKKCVGGTVTRTATACTGTTTTTLTLDSLNRTTNIVQGTLTESYAYDHSGRRIRKLSGTATSNYLYQGEDIYAEYGTAYTAPVAVYTHGPATDDPLIRLTGTIGPNATPQYYHQDGLGSVVAMSNATGGTDATTRYDAWGNKVTSTGTTPQYGYTGREPDATGLVYYRARYYDPTQRRFTQRDPIGFGGGINQYAYVNNNPINYNDPNGLRAREITSSMDAIASYFGSSNNYGSSGTGISSGSQSLTSVAPSQGVGTTNVSTGYTNSAVYFGNHALVIGTDPITQEQYATRAGPVQNQNGGCCVLGAVADPYDQQFRDSPSQVHTVQNVGTLNVPLATFASNAREFSGVTNASQVSYLGLTSNSNAYAFTFVESLGLTRPTPPVWAPGYNDGTPSPSLSYPVPQ